jgi:protein TonB
VRRILIALLLAVGIHGLLLGMEWDWVNRHAIERPEHSPILMTLTIKQPLPPVRDIIDTPATVPEKKPAAIPAPVKKKIPSITPKPKRRKHRTPAPGSKEKKVSAPAPKIEAKSWQGKRETAIKHKPRAIVNEKISPSPAQATIEARPLYRVNPPPEYPAMARRRGYSGQVVLEVLVGQNGSVVDLRVVTSSGHDMLDRAAVKAVKTWVFEPGMRGSKTVDMWVRVPIRFELK